MPSDPSSRTGSLLGKFLLLLAAGSIAVSGLYLATCTVREERLCKTHLLRIYSALELYEMERGALPQLAFYPDDPSDGPDSLRGALENYGVEYSSCICPSEGRLVRDSGQSYIWNAALSGRKLPSGAPVWLLVELSALSVDVPPPHWGSYHVLYSDGHVGTVRDPLRELPGL